MKNKMAMTILAASLSAFGGQAFAQTADQTAEDAARANTTVDNERDAYDDDDGFDWGLLGLIGLAGLIPRKRNDVVVRDTIRNTNDQQGR